MSIPSYTNLLFVIINEILSSQEGIPINVLDLFSALSTIINSLVIIYFIYLTKLYKIYIRNKIKKKIQHKKTNKLRKKDGKQNSYIPLKSSTSINNFI